MAAIVAVVEFKGDSKKIYPFNVYPLNEECDRESGVYIFTKRSLNSSTVKYEHNICFIGSAETIPNKLYDHQKALYRSKCYKFCVLSGCSYRSR